MKSFKTHLVERDLSSKDLHPKYKGMSTGELAKKAADNRAHSPKDRAHMKAEIAARGQVREAAQLDELSSKTLKSYRDKSEADADKHNAAGMKINNTPPGKREKGSYSKMSKHFDKANKRNSGQGMAAYKLHKKTLAKEETISELYFLQPDGTWKNNGDGRSRGMTKGELKAKGLTSKIREHNINEERKYVHNRITTALSKNGAKYKHKAKPGHDEYHLANGKKITSDGVGIKVHKGGKEQSYHDRPKLNYTKAVHNAVSEMAVMGAPGNNTQSGPGMGSDTSLKLKKARLFKDIYKRHGTTKESSYKGVPKGNR